VAFSEQTKHLYEFGPFRIDSVERVLSREGEAVPLAPKVFDILLMLVENAGHIVEKDKLMKEVWPDSFVEEGNLTQNVSTLRKALAEGADGREYVQTVARRGYRFVAHVREVLDEGSGLIVEERSKPRLDVEREEELSVAVRYTAEGEQAKQENALTSSRWDQTGSKWRLSAVLAGFVMLVGLAVAVFYVRSVSTQKPPATDTHVKSLAVLPFKPLVPEERDPVYELGLAHSLIFRLSTVKEIVVRPIESMRKYTDLDVNPVAAGRELGVDFVLSSHYQMSGDKIRVTSQLINVHDGSTFETFKCDEKCANVFETQDAISLKVGQRLLTKLTDEQRSLLTKRYTENKEAYDLYLKGWYLWSQTTEAGLKKAIEYFNQALDNDPKYALAYHGLTACHLVLGVLFLDPKEEMLKAKAAAMKAMELDDTLAETHASLGGVAFFYDWDWSTAEREFKRAIDLDPNLVRAHHWYADYLSAMERHDEAIAEMNRAMELEGSLSFGHSNLARIFFQARRYDEAIEQCRKGLNTDVTQGEIYRVLGQSHWEKGIRDEAIAELNKANTFARARGITRITGPLGYAYAMSGKRGEAEKLLDDLKARSKQRYVSSYFAAQIYAGLGERDQVFACLNKACEAHSHSLAFIKVDPIFDNLRSDVRFADLVRRIGLPQ
jgi:DNA-binding winged helix-turn-helix (wHTH) protein/TolB-like protein/Flp pilus assembly protein TadD